MPSLPLPCGALLWLKFICLLSTLCGNFLEYRLWRCKYFGENSKWWYLLQWPRDGRPKGQTSQSHFDTEVKNCMAQGAQKAISIPKGDSCWFPRIVVQFCGRHSQEEQRQFHGNLVSSVEPSYPSQKPASQELAQRSRFQRTQFFFYFSQQRSASQNPNLIFFKCCVNEILECAPFCSYPSCSNNMTISCVFHYNLADGNILFHVNINKGRFDLAQKCQIKRGNFQFKIQEGNLLFCAETYQRILVASIYTREKIKIYSLLES